MKTDELREKYLTFFESKGCVRRPSDVLVPRWDPSVLFTPAGMNQFKDHFLGKCKLEFTRATTCQKCLRTGDIENVGRTAYHHTFFEMLGNFSFGDYFKRDAIHWAWEFLTSPKWLGLDADRLSVSVYLDDDEAASIWQQEIKLPSTKIQRLDEHENFWPAGAPSHGPDGVCGPCSEIFYHYEGGSVEIWNLVFTQFNRVGEPPDNLRPLPSKNIDTGMGLERAASVLQQVDTNFHIDILKPLVLAAAEVCGMKYEAGTEQGRRLRRIADHVRACTFAVHENVYPGPNKEKYVVKRLLRRAVLDGHQMGVNEPFLCRLVPVVAEQMSHPYPELRQTVERVAHVIEKEESNFLGTIDEGLSRIERLFEEMKRKSRTLVSGREAADMYTTHGFPPELFEAMAAEHNLMFDWDGFRREMEQHGLESGGGQRVELFQSGPLDALKRAMGGTEFLGYQTTEATGKIVGLIAQNELCDRIDEIGHDQPVIVVLDRSPFYGESGGQLGDNGQLLAEGMQFEVVDTVRDGGFILHLGHLKQGELHLGETVTARVDSGRRAGPCSRPAAHSALCLAKHLGTHAPARLEGRSGLAPFRFYSSQSFSAEEVGQIESEVNTLISAADPISWQNMPLAEARKSGAMMLFGEKYPDVVRMVSMGDFSKELCGGTHLDNTSQVGLFKIVGEESVAAGTRRITALTGPASIEKIRQNEQLLAESAALLKVPMANLPGRIEALTKELRTLKKQVAAVSKTGDLSADKLLEQAVEIAGVKVIVAEVPGGNPATMREQIDQLRRKAAPVAVLLGSRAGGKVALVAGISRDVEARGFSAVEWIRAAAQPVGGSGGGRNDMAQAGGKEPAKLPAAIESALELARQKFTA